MNVKPFDSVRPADPPPLCGIVVGSSWHEPIACAYPPDHDGPHSWASIPAFPSRGRMTKREAGIRLVIIAGEILLTLDDDEDAPSWPDDLIAIADALGPGAS